MSVQYPRGPDFSKFDLRVKKRINYDSVAKSDQSDGDIAYINHSIETHSQQDFWQQQQQKFRGAKKKLPPTNNESNHHSED